MASTFHKVGLHTVRDVLYQLPRRYEDRRNLPPIRSLRIGEFASVKGKVLSVNTRPLRGGKVILKVGVSDGTGTVFLTWFNQPWIAKKLAANRGEMNAYGMGKDGSACYEINSPEYELMEEGDDPDEFTRIVPVYPLTEGLALKTMRKAATSAVEGYLDLVEEPLPVDLRRNLGLMGLKAALKEIHQPTADETRVEARRRLVFEEFLYLHLALAMRRKETQQELGIAFPIADLKAGRIPQDVAAAPPQSKRAAVVKKSAHASHLFEEEQAAKFREMPLMDQIKSMFPFDLTGAQKRVIEEIFVDMQVASPMNRLVQGDVGSGKTAVAACAMLAAVRSGYQAAMMAPTEILAEQHYRNLQKGLEPPGTSVVLLVGKLTKANKEKATNATMLGTAKIAVGTHALIQEGVKFDRLGLVVVDEQHRFGVMQRAALREKGLGNPDVLVMTATPIPRSLTMTLYGDLDLSVIDELPPGRRPIKTYWKQPFERDGVYAGVATLLKEGRQAYFVCPMINENEKMATQAATDLHYRLSEGPFKEFRVGLLHGQMKSADKEEIMDRFRLHDLDILVSTTVIEVGVDVPNASVMVIEDANRFGLSQLHQLRGRVGRGEYQSFCILISDARSEGTQRRMDTMVETNDGFRISEVDLEIRGPGEIAGTRQHGNLDFKVADLVQDGVQLEVARQAAIKIVDDDPTLSQPENLRMLERVKDRRERMAVVAIS